MSIESGQKLLHYTIVEKLGEGGMGAVWRATDTTLNRDVAIKILPQHFAEDPERLARFEREAKVLASLNHPNIAAIYALHAEGNTRFLAMELVDGEDLQVQLTRGPLSLDQALDVAIQMAAGIEAAHEKGIVHRDLKPANVVRTSDGTVKVLDFGLAKPFLDGGEGTSGTVDLSASPTMTHAGTMAGMILGTASYMSPEQARGQAVDQRSDVWSFGCVLFELLSGTKPFGGETLTDVLASIVRAEPDWDRVAGTVPASIVAIIKRCLRKKARDRLRSVGDIGLTLKTLADEGVLSSSAVAGRRGLSPAIVAGSLLVVAIVAGGLGSLLSRPDPVVEPSRRFSIRLPDGTFLPAGVGTVLAVSRDGKNLAYVADDHERRMLYVRGDDDFDSRLLPGTEGATGPFFSPDGEWLGFRSAGGLEKISISTLEIYRICDECNWGTWTDDGEVIVERDDAIWRIPDAGGQLELVAGPDPKKGFQTLIRPHAISGSRVVLFESGALNSGGVGVISLETGETLRISEDGSDPIYSPTGHIVFGRENTLFAVPFDPRRFEVTGRVSHVLQGVRVENAGALQAVISDNGTLIYAPAGTTSGTRLTWVDRQGNTTPANDQWRLYRSPRISPNGKQIAVVVVEGGKSDVWLVDADFGGMTPLTTSGTASDPVWTPDGTHVTVTEGSAPTFTVASISVERSGQKEILFSNDGPVRAQAWHPNGNLLIYAETAGNTKLFVFDASAATRTPLFDRDTQESAASLSPDGKRLSYVSDKTGDNEVYVTSFPELGAEILVSIGGGQGPFWSRDGLELFYRSDRRYTSNSIDDLRAKGRDLKFDAASFWEGTSEAHADAHPDGERFLVLQKNEGETPSGINVVLDWFDELRRKAPSDR